VYIYFYIWYTEHKLKLKWSKALYQDVHEYHELPDLFVLFNRCVCVCVCVCVCLCVCIGVHVHELPDLFALFNNGIGNASADRCVCMCMRLCVCVCVCVPVTRTVRALQQWHRTCIRGRQLERCSRSPLQ
jgi:hypothetical protein